MKHLSTLIVAFLISTASLCAQADTASSAANWKASPNPGFEAWTTVSGFFGNYYNPNGWNTANSQTASVGTYCVTEGAAYTGKYSAQLTTQNIAGNMAPGIITTGTIPTSTTGSITGGIAYTLRPDSIVGWYKYTPAGSDNCFASLDLFGSAANNADTVATASFQTVAGKTTSTWTRFSAPLKYRNSDPVANSLWLICSSGNSTGVQGSVMYVDDVAIIINNTTGIANQVNTGNNITVSPNPASDHITVIQSIHSSATIAIYDITGREVSEQKLDKGSNTIDVKGLTNGIYIYTVIAENNNSVKTGKLIIQK